MQDDMNAKRVASKKSTVPRSYSYLARDKSGLIITFEACNYDEAIGICRQEGWLYIGWRDEDDDSD